MKNILKKTWLELLEVKTVMSKVKNILDGINGRL